MAFNTIIPHTKQHPSKGYFKIRVGGIPKTHKTNPGTVLLCKEGSSEDIWTLRIQLPAKQPPCVREHHVEARIEGLDPFGHLGSSAGGSTVQNQTILSEIMANAIPVVLHIRSCHAHAYERLFVWRTSSEGPPWHI